MKNALAAGALYFVVAFGAGFVLGTIRVFALAPRIGEIAAVAIELPLMLTISWIACGRLIRAFAVPEAAAARALMGTVAFMLLIGAELALGVAAFGRTFAEQIAAWKSPAGALGIAGQIAFALFPLAMRRPT